MVPLKDKRRVTIVNAFLNILDSLKRKPNEIWVDQGSEFYNNSFKKVLLKDLLEHWKIRFTNIWQLCQKMIIFMF